MRAAVVMSSYSLREQLASVLNAERAAVTLQDQVAQLFEEARDDVYRYLLTLGLHPPQAQEAAQEVFLRLYVTMKRGEEIRSPRAWIFRVAHNLGLKIRAKENSQPPFDPAFEAKLPGREPSPEESLLSHERMARFHAAIGSLSEQQRRCLFLRLEGLRYPEIAATLGISASAVGEFLRRAIARIRKVNHE